MDSVSISSAYMWAFVSFAVLFLIAIVIANAIMFKPNDPGTTSRRVWFWILCVCTGVASFVINFLIAKGIDVPSLHSTYITQSVIASVCAMLLYIILGFIVSKVFSNSKVGTWF